MAVHHKWIRRRFDLKFLVINLCSQHANALECNTRSALPQQVLAISIASVYEELSVIFIKQGPVLLSYFLTGIRIYLSHTHLLCGM